ncbi:arginine deiminase family protein [Olivibacter sitiensis]|uniref:arginine deiminase family protein n=1 Tax=Olivibacter sitiensis TaxID=376470 RepID=UPI0004052179|nr:arginine deiminase family protein [Olivibacter sitiensis]
MIQVSSEIGTLKKIIVHSPDSGLGKVVPSKAQDWLFEDIVHLKTVRMEYDYYLKLLLYFLDPTVIKGKLGTLEDTTHGRAFFKPDSAGFYRSDKVIEVQRLLADILENESIRKKLVASVCAIEGCTYQLQLALIDTAPKKLAKIILSGALDDEHMIFAPIPNLIFTRDLAVVINDHILLNKPAKKARSRENLIMRYVLFNHPFFASYAGKILEIPDSVQYFLRPEEDYDNRATLEGGDVMTISPSHVLIGCSERTSAQGANEAIKLLFQHGVVEKVTLVKIPNKRDFMHIDTLFTQVKKNVWALLASVSKKAEPNGKEPIHHFHFMEKTEPDTAIIQFRRDAVENPRTYDCLEDLLDEISQQELQSKEPTKFIYSGNNIFPYDAREQWTDSCNLLALKEGVVLGYDRNDKTVSAFKQAGFDVIGVKELITQLENGQRTAQDIENTLILMPSAELSRARGGFHCMSLPILREHL